VDIWPSPKTDLLVVYWSEWARIKDEVMFRQVAALEVKLMSGGLFECVTEMSVSDQSVVELAVSAVGREL